MRQKNFTQLLLLLFFLVLGTQGTWAETFTVNYHVGDNNYSVEREAGATLSLDTPDAIGSMDFAGWSSSKNVTSPVWVANTAKVTGDMELYAFFTISETMDGYYLVEEALTDWRGDYLIACSPTKFADGRKGGTDTGCIGRAGVYVNPSSYYLTGNKVTTSWGDAYNVTLVAIDDDDLTKGYLLKTKDGKYNYYTKNSDNGISTSSYVEAPSLYPITVTFTSSSDVKLKLGGDATGSVFRYHSSSKYFRFIANGGQSPVYLYKKGLRYSLGKSKSVTISAAKYATYCSDEGLNFSETGAKVYTAKVTDGVVKLTEIESGIVPANTGFMIYKDVAATEELSVPVQKTDATVSNNELVGLTEKTAVPWTADGKYNYILQKKAGEDKAKFYKATGAELIANRAYLSTTFNVATESHGLDIIIDGEEEGDVTSLADVKSKKDDVRSDYYDLQGRKVIQPNVKGIYVVNGKKFVVK